MKHAYTIFLAAALAACSTAPVETPEFASTPFVGFDEADPDYVLFPGDELSIAFRRAPELDAEVKIGPDGRVQLPLGLSMMVANKTATEVQTELVELYATELVDPSASVTITEFGSQQVFVGGEVRQPGAYDLPGQIDPLQAVILAGGFTDLSDSRQVLLIRRGPDGETYSKLFNVSKTMNKAQFAEFERLSRFDVIYVPRTAIANQNQFVQQYIRNALPVNFGFYYDISGGN